MEFDQSLMKQAVAYQAMSQPAPRPPSPHPVLAPNTSPAPLGRTASQSQSQPPPAAQLSNGAPLQNPTGQSPHAHVTRGRNKRARSPSSDPAPSPHPPSSQHMSGMSPSQARFQLPHAQPALQPQWPQHSQLHAQHLQQQQQQQQPQPQQQLMSGGLPAGVVALGPQQMSYQPLHANPGHAVSPARLSPKGPSLHQQPTQQQPQHQQQPQQQPQQQQQQPKQLPVRAMPLGRASQQGRSRVAIPVVKPDHVDGMTHEDIIAAAAAAAAASGYGEPVGLASLVGTRVKVSKNKASSTLPGFLDLSEQA